MWRSADGPESIVTPSASNEWMVFTWKDGTTLRIRLRGLDGSGVAADTSGAATLISDPGAAIDHAIYAASETTVEEFLVINPDDAANADSRTFIWDIVGLPADWKVADAGGGIITLFDTATGEQKMSISAPVVQDEGGKQLMSSFDLEDRNTFSLSIDTDLAEGRILADPVFFMTSVGYMQQNYCKGGISSCSVPSDASQPNLSGNAVGAYYTSASSYAYGPSVIATSTAVPVSAISRMIYTPPAGLKLYSLNVQSGNVRTGASRFACGIQGQKAGSWGYVAGSFVTYSGSTQNNFYNRSLVHNQIFNGNYLDAAAVTMINNTSAAANGGSAHRCTLETGGVLYAALYDTDNPNQDAAPYSGTTWYGPNNPTLTPVIDVSDYGSGVAVMQPVFTYSGGPSDGQNVVYPSIANQPHPAFDYCRGVGAGPNHQDVRPCYTDPAPTTVSIGLSPNLQNTSTALNRTNLFRWKITDFTGRTYFAPQLELRWDSVAPVAPAFVSDGSGNDIDEISPASAINFRWTTGSDSGGGVGGYHYCVDQSADISSSWCSSPFVDASIGPQTAPSVLAYVPSSANGASYRVCARTVDRSSNLSTAKCSDGVTFNNLAPAAPLSLVDGTSGVDASATADDMGASATFAQPNVKSVEACVVPIAQGAGSCASWLAVAPDGEGGSIDVPVVLQSGSSYRTCVRFVGHNGLTGAAACTDGFVVDLGAPMTPSSVRDGSSTPDVSQAAGGSSVALSFGQPLDTGGGTVTSAVVCWYPIEESQGCDSPLAAEQQSPVDANTTSVATVNPTMFIVGRTYIGCVSFVDAAQNESAQACTNGINIVGASMDASSTPSAYQSSTSEIQAFVATPESPLAESIEYCVTQGADAASCQTWTSESASNTHVVVDGLTLTNDEDYRLCYRTLDNGGLPLADGCTGTVSVDTVPPAAVSNVLDGDVAGVDSEESASSTAVAGIWPATTDPGGLLEKYKSCVRIGTTECAPEDWEETSATTDVHPVDDIYGETVDVCVKAVDAAGNESTAVCSDGQQVSASIEEVEYQAGQRDLVGLSTAAVEIEEALADPDSTPIMGAVADPVEASVIESAYQDLAAAEAAIDASTNSTIVDVRATSGSDPQVDVYVTGNASTIETDLEQNLDTDAKARLDVSATPVSGAAIDAARESIDGAADSLASQGAPVASVTVDGSTGATVASVVGGDAVQPSGETVSQQLNGVSATDGPITVVPAPTSAQPTVDETRKTNVIKKHAGNYGGGFMTLDQVDGQRLYNRCTSNASLRRGGATYLITAYHCWRSSVNSRSRGVVISGGPQIYKSATSDEFHHQRYKLTNEVTPAFVSQRDDFALFRLRNGVGADSDIFEAPTKTNGTWGVLTKDITRLSAMHVGDIACQSGINVPYKMGTTLLGFTCGKVIASRTVAFTSSPTELDGTPYTLAPTAWAVAMPACRGDSGGAVWLGSSSALLGTVSANDLSSTVGLQLPAGKTEQVILNYSPETQKPTTTDKPLAASTGCVEQGHWQGSTWVRSKFGGITWVTSTSTALKRLGATSAHPRFSLVTS